MVDLEVIKKEYIVYLGRYKCLLVDGGCHECCSNKPKTDGRYYSVKYKQKSYLLHRLIFENTIKKIPTGFILRHTCDNVLCVNPRHLIIGTHKDNSNDARIRGRLAKGEKNAMSKLTQNDVDEIRSSVDDKHTLSNLYGVDERTIRNIIANRTWVI